MKRILLLFLFFIFTNSFAQPITVNTTTYTVPQLVQDVLFGNGTAGSSCVGTIENISWKTGSGSSNGTTFNSSNGIGYFTNTNPNFPIANGVILSTGTVNTAPGPNNNTQSNGNVAWTGDADLFDYMFDIGIVDNTNDYNNATVLEFDFVPLTDEMSFDFLFASEEYGDFQCNYSDAFAFFLTNTTVGTPAINLALVPNTTIPISVTTIRDDTGLPTCDEANPSYFGFNNQGGNAGSAAINFNGQTKLMTATSPVIPGNTYHIKLVIADLDDQSWDSAVFLGGGSFSIGTLSIAEPGDIDGLSDLTIADGTALCGSSSIAIQAGAITIPGVTYNWYLDGGIISGANTNVYTIDEPGIYDVEINYPGGCQQTDSLVVEFYPDLTLVTPSDIIQCTQPFDVNENENLILNGNSGNVSYHYTLAGAQQSSDYILNPNSYNGLNGNTVYVAVEDDNTGCITVIDFDLISDPTLCIPPVIPVTPTDLALCEATNGSNSAIFNFTSQVGVAYGTYSVTDYTLTFHTSQIDADSGNNPISPINSFPGNNNQEVYIRLEDNANPTAYGTTSFTLFVNSLPTVSITSDSPTCTGTSATITFTGTPDSTVTFNYDSNPNETISLNNLGTANIVTPILTSDSTYTLVSIQDSNSPSCSQSQTGSTTVTVNDAPLINTPTPYEVCDDNNDGKSCLFVLTTKNNEISTDPTVVITYHETPTDAQTGANPVSTTTYCSIDNSGFQTLHVRAYFTGTPACFSTTTLQLIVNPRPFANPIITDYALCDYTNPGDGEEVFTLNTKTAEIINGQVGLTVTYYETETDAQNQVNPLPNSYTNTTIGAPQTIWINIRNVTTGCNSVSSFNIVVNPLPVAVTPLPIFECSIGTSTTQADFDLTVNENVTTAGATGVTVTYYLSLPDAQTPVNAITSPTTFLGNDGQTIYIRVEYTATGCYSTTTQLLRVTEGPTANVPQPLNYCDPNNDGFGIFDLDSTITAITGGQAGVTVTFHETETDAEIGANAKTSPYANIDINQQTIYVRVFYTTTGCSNFVELQLIVNPTPEATIPDDLHLCDYTGAVGYEPFDLTLVIPQVLGTINPATHVVTFYNDATNAQQGINNITATSGYINGIINQETIYVRVETIATGCFDIVDFDIIVDPLPLITTPNYPQYSLCDKDQTKIGYEIFDLNSKVVDILLGQTGMSVTFYPSLTDAQNNTNAITNLNYENTAIYVQTLGIRITNTTTNCYVISTMDIRVEPLPSPIPPIEPYTVCDDNQDGVSCAFDLTTLVADLVQSANYTITFHETQDNANDGVDAINTTINYCNIDPFVQLLYVRAVDNLTGCWSTLPIELNVNPSPSAPVNVPNIEVCDTDTNTQNAITNVNLAQQTAIVLAQQPLPATSYVVTYHTNPTDAGTGNNEIVNTSSYSASNGQTIWVRVENIATGCYNVGSFQVLINIPLIVATPTPINECDDDANPNDQFTNFDLTVRTIAPADHTLNYYPSLGQAQSNTNEITTITNYTNTAPAVQTLGVKITTPAGCVSYTTLNVRVLPIPEPLDPSAATPEMVLPAECENGTNSGQQILDLTLNEAYIKNGETTLELHYFPTLADLENNTNELLTPNAALVGDTTLTGDPIDLVQYVYIAVSSPNYTDYTGRDCFKIIKQGYIINPLPTVNTITYRLCETAPIDQTEVFDLTSQTSDLLAGNATTPSSTYSLSYYTDASLSAVSQITTPSAFTNTSDPQIIYVVATNNSTGCSSDVAQMTLAVEEAAFATGPQIVSTCDDYDNPYDGVYQLDLTDLSDEILAGQNPAIFLVSYYTSQVDAIAGTNALSVAEAQLYTTDADVDTIWVKVENSSNTIVPVCYAITTIEIDIERYPNPIIDTDNGVNTICVNYENDQVIRPLTLESGISNPSDYTFEWFEGTSTTVIGTDPNYIVNTAEASGATRSYTVKVTSISALGCSTTSEVFEVIQSGPAVVAAGTTGYTVTNAFSDNQIITVTVEGYGTYQYSIDDGPRQDSNIFENVSFGEHTIYVWDTEGGIAYSCEVLEINNVQIIDYPHYFTPNGDGIHDTWNIVGLSNQPTAKIYIFDRYGKLLKQISSTGDGWDGSYNGQPLPSTDYWFSVQYLEQNVSKEFKAHFSLKR